MWCHSGWLRAVRNMRSITPMGRGITANFSHTGIVFLGPPFSSKLERKWIDNCDGSHLYIVACVSLPSLSQCRVKLYFVCTRAVLAMCEHSRTRPLQPSSDWSILLWNVWCKCLPWHRVPLPNIVWVWNTSHKQQHFEWLVPVNTVCDYDDILHQVPGWKPCWY